MKANLRQALKKYKNIRDCIVFGSLVKAKHLPKDIDIALVMDAKETAIIGEIKEQIKNADIEIITPEEIYQSRLGLTLITEGFSIKNNKFLRELLQIKPMKIYTYQIKHLPQIQKVLFGRGLNHAIKETKGIKIGAGSIMIPIETTGNFEEFLDTWGLKYKTKEYLVL